MSPLHIAVIQAERALRDAIAVAEATAAHLQAGLDALGEHIRAVRH